MVRWFGCVQEPVARIEEGGEVEFSADPALVLYVERVSEFGGIWG